MVSPTIVITYFLTLGFGYTLGKTPDPNMPFLPFKQLHTNAAIDGPQPWFDDQVPSKDHCFHKCLKNFTDCEYVQYKKVTATTWLCKLFGVISDLSHYLVSTEGEMLAYAVHENIDCADWMNRGYNQSGVYWIYHERNKFKVWCDMHPEHGIARIKIQARFDGSVDFYRNWEEYRTGFGDPKGEYWLGLENIHKLTHGRTIEIILWAASFQDDTRYAIYKNFSIAGESDHYRLHAGVFDNGFESSPDEWLKGDGMKFSTYDFDGDIDLGHCAEHYQSGWWHSDCFWINFNGVYSQTDTISYAQGIIWQAWKGYWKSLKQTAMAIRRLD